MQAVLPVHVYQFFLRHCRTSSRHVSRCESSPVWKKYDPENTTTAYFFQFFLHTPLGSWCISPTQHLLSRVPSHQILEPRSLKASTVFSSLPVWNAVAAVVCSIRNCSFAKTQLYRNWNDQRIFLCTSNKSSLAQKVLNQPSSFLLK